MSVEQARFWLLLLNAPVGVFTAMAMFAALFGLAAPEPNPVRWLAIVSPLLLAAWLAFASQLARSEHAKIGLLMLSIPIVLLVALLVAAFMATS